MLGCRDQRNLRIHCLVHCRTKAPRPSYFVADQNAGLRGHGAFSPFGLAGLVNDKV